MKTNYRKKEHIRRHRWTEQWIEQYIWHNKDDREVPDERIQSFGDKLLKGYILRKLVTTCVVVLSLIHDVKLLNKKCRWTNKSNIILYCKIGGNGQVYMSFSLPINWLIWMTLGTFDVDAWSVVVKCYLSWHVFK